MQSFLVYITLKFSIIYTTFAQQNLFNTKYKIT